MSLMLEQLIGIPLNTQTPPLEHRCLLPCLPNKTLLVSYLVILPEILVIVRVTDLHGPSKSPFCLRHLFGLSLTPKDNLTT